MSEIKTSNAWEFGTRQVVYGAIGAALYGVLSWATNIFPLPAAGRFDHVAIWREVSFTTMY